MDSRIIEILSEEIRETRNLTLAVKDETTSLTFVLNETAKQFKEEIKETKRRADAAWELVVMTREEMKKPLWRRWFG